MVSYNDDIKNWLSIKSLILQSDMKWNTNKKMGAWKSFV